MTFPRLTFRRIILAVLVLWFVLGLVALALFSNGGTTPGQGQGQRVEIR